MLAIRKNWQIRHSLLLLMSYSLLLFAQDSPSQLQNLRVKKKLGIEQVILTFSKSIESKGHYLRASDVSPNARYYVDFSTASLNENFPSPNLGGDFTLIQSVRIAQKDKDTVRIVLDLPKTLDQNNIVLEHKNNTLIISLAKKATDLAILQLEESGPVQLEINSSKTDDLTQSSSNQSAAKSLDTSKPSTPPIDIEIPSTQEIEISPMSAPANKTQQAPKQTPEVIINPPKTKSNKHIIIIDAGHGGEDSGARGPFYKTNEKDVTLSIAKRLKKILDQDDHYRVLMTRESDTYLHLWDRTNFANKHHGDLFVSIHANANKKNTANGVSTYFLHNADDEESLRVAMRENGELAVPKTKKTPQNDAYFLEIMKASMLKNFHTVQSTDLARIVQNSLFKHLSQNYNNVYNRGVKSARFYVLTGANMPAILVETSFITNKLEEKRLRNTAYQYQIALAIYRGIQGYFKQQNSGLSHARLY
ncbi:MAG TPA: N-acetylmuramoyl-L-alanine amidase [Oligoflexia bacterium]|nr:N-acetylmuramoyl-L-alanine amidase [Oligoflexia bacterium]HMR25149.1 N-acetylmuramoyl-L-alanine amidase [Oligoflexia bacterium]